MRACSALRATHVPSSVAPSTHVSHAGRGADAALARGGEAGLLERGLQREHARGRRAVGALVGRPDGGEVELGLGEVRVRVRIRVRARVGVRVGVGVSEVELRLGERGVPHAVHLQLLDLRRDVRPVLLVAARRAEPRRLPHHTHHQVVERAHLEVDDSEVRVRVGVGVEVGVGVRVRVRVRVGVGVRVPTWKWMIAREEAW